jgi:group I intron endonuclease
MGDIKSGVYIIENMINHKKYIGSSKNIKRRLIVHKSSLRHNTSPHHHLQFAFNKYGEKNFDFRLLIDCSEDQLLFWEKKMFEAFRCCEREFGYNLGLDPTTTKHSEETKTKIGIGNKGKKYSIETRKQISVATTGEKNHNFGKKASSETRKKMSETRSGDKHPLFGKHHSLESRKQMSEAHIGQIISPETRKKISEANIGKKMSPESIEKTRIANTGLKRSIEARKKMSLARTGKKYPSANNKIKKK